MPCIYNPVSFIHNCESLSGFDSVSATNATVDSTVKYDGASSIRLDRYGRIVGYVYPLTYPNLSPVKTLYARALVRMASNPMMDLLYVNEIGLYCPGAPYYGFFNSTSLHIVKSGTKWYWQVNETIIASEVVAGTWYRVEILVSTSLNKLQLKIDGNLIYDDVCPLSAGRIQAVGFRSYPTQTFPVGGERLNIDCIATSFEDWIGTKYIGS